MRKLVSFFGFIVFLFSFPASINATNNITMKLDYQSVVLDQMPYVQSERVYIPLRAVTELTGGIVHYNSQSKIITVAKDSSVITFHINGSVATVNGVTKEIPKALVRNERTLVPVRFVSENLGLTVDWKSEEKAVYIYSNAMIKIDGIIQHAETYIGTPYLWGGTTAKGFDCSGFVQKIFGERGITLSRTTYTQINEGVAIEKERLKKGDLIFFDLEGQGKPTHVAIYIDENKLLQASSSKGVDYTTFKGYWSERAIAYKRVIV